jgi:hypothetical protein
MYTRDTIYSSSSSDLPTTGLFNYNHPGILRTPDPNNSTMLLSSPFFSYSSPNTNDFSIGNLPPLKVEQYENASPALDPADRPSTERQMEILKSENKIFHNTFNQLLKLQNDKDLEIGHLNKKIECLNKQIIKLKEKRKLSPSSTEDKPPKKNKLNTKTKKLKPTEIPVVAHSVNSAINNFLFFSQVSEIKTANTYLDTVAVDAAHQITGIGNPQAC